MKLRRIDPWVYLALIPFAVIPYIVISLLIVPSLYFSCSFMVQCSENGNLTSIFDFIFKYPAFAVSYYLGYLIYKKIFIDKQRTFLIINVVIAFVFILSNLVEGTFKF
jgi:hypothetical protein